VFTHIYFNKKNKTMNLKSNDLTKRYSIFPITHPDLWEFYKKAEKQTWVAEEIDLSKDRFDGLTDSEKMYLKNILAFFAISDGLVIDNLATNFMGEVDLLEAQYFYGHQTFIEQVHANGYSLLIEAYIKDEKEKTDLFNSMETSPSVAAKASWAEKWIDHPSFTHRLIAFACVEGISFSSVFAGVFWYRSRNKMEGLASMNELIIRDETLHYEFAVNLYNNYVINKLSTDEVREIILSCCAVEETFVRESMPNGLMGLTTEMMVQYVQYVTDVVLKDFGLEPEFRVHNPLDYMARIGLSAKNNFFEQRIGQYTRVDIPTTTEGIFDDDF
jgi:ribonucleoside-diphosphate reductase beta chain